ncbi:MAG: hypothetical protein HOY79_18205 [Streptomyces sp.]|nr:hypothetical protein [Streptomyces sp.]
MAIAAVISAVTGVLTFLVGFIGLPAAGVKSPVGAEATVTATTTVTAQAPSAKGGDGASPAQSSGDTYAKRWSGRVEFAGYFDFDAIPPSSTGTGDVHIAGITDGGEAELTGYTSVLLAEGKAPSPAECTQLVQTQGSDDVTVAAGRTVCLITSDGRPAAAKVVSVSSPSSGRVAFDVTVWEKPA